jgi:hypothetical protein
MDLIVYERLSVNLLALSRDVIYWMEDLSR